MNILTDIIIIVVALGLLIYGAEIVMKGAVIIAKSLKISDLVIASTLIALGTGLPTIAVNIAFVLTGGNNADAAIGNALGTNFVNIGLGLGIPAFILTIVTKYQVFEKEIPIYLAVVGLLSSFAFDGIISRIEGVVILLAYIVTLIIIYQYAAREKLQKQDIEEIDVDSSTITNTEVTGKSIIYAVLNIVIGIILLIGISIVLAVLTPRFSTNLGISEYILGLTVIGIGTSLPMIVTSTKSAIKGYVDIVLGNVFGGTIANIALGIGLPSIFVPLTFNTEALNDLYYFDLLNILVVFGILIEMKLLGKDKTLNRVSGIIIILFYIIYLVTKIL